MGLDLTSFDALTFDCYGTLIDWQSGIAAAMLPVLQRTGNPADAAWVTRRFGELERVEQSEPYRSYREVLRGVAREMLGPDATDADLDALAESVGDWPAFDDTINALRALKRRYKLAIVSNVDRDTFIEGSLPRLGGAGGVEFDAVVTAEDVRAYKPARAHFHEAARRLELPFDRILHVAESRFHDIEPANALGIASVHVDRAAGGESPSGAGAGTPDLTVRSMTELAALVEQAFGAS